MTRPRRHARTAVVVRVETLDETHYRGPFATVAAAKAEAGRVQAREAAWRHFQEQYGDAPDTRPVTTLLRATHWEEVPS